ncbi:MAG: hypothetical protein ACRDLO_11730 [Solirubrobacterales bacterium]
MVQREGVIEWLNWVLGPRLTGNFIDEVIRAIELAAAGRGADQIEIDCDRMTVAEAVQIWELEPLVERVRDGEPIRHGPDIDPEPDFDLESAPYDNFI